LLALLGDHGVARPVDPEAHAVVVDLLFVADESTGALALAAKLGDERNIHLLAAGSQCLADADDRVERCIHVGGEEIFANVFAVDLFGVADKLVVVLNGGDGHRYVLSVRPAADQSQRAIAKVKSPSSLTSLSAGHC